MSSKLGELRDVALDARRNNRPRTAIEAYLELERLDPEEPGWPKAAADCYERLGDEDAQIAALDRAASRYAARGFVVRAIAMRKMIIARRPDHADALTALANLQGARRLGLDRFQRPKRPSSPPSSAPFDAAPIDLVMGSRPAAGVDDSGVLEIPLEVGRGPQLAGTEIEAIAAAPLFAMLSPETLGRLVAEVQLVDVADGATLYEVGDPADTMFIVVDGRVRLYSSDRTPAMIADLGPGDVLGVVGLVADEPRPLSAVATEPCRLLSLHRRSLLTLVRETEGLREAVIDLARQRLLAAVFATHEMFALLDAATLDRLVAKFRFFQVREGSRLLEVGRPNKYLLVILTGYYDMRFADGTGDTLRVGNVVNTELATAAPAPGSLVANKNGFVLALDADDYRAVVGHGRRAPVAVSHTPVP
ncbi:MAG: cyclic nucleotide-binding domain-containing protein [Myxococcales bacterium]|nr:cyclic nucleotide-binding domain-containing protein [Myxococcales bacterium]